MIDVPVSYDVAPTPEIGHLTGLCSPLVAGEEQHASRIDLLGCYLREIDRYPLLTPTEECLLLTQVAQGDQHARARVIEANLRLVGQCCKNAGECDKLSIYSSKEEEGLSGTSSLRSNGVILKPRSFSCASGGTCAML